MTSSSVWAEVKKSIASDARYDAVGSSSLRQELFDTYLKKLASSSAVSETPEEAAERKVRERKAKEEASLREGDAGTGKSDSGSQQESSWGWA
jgi:transcription elongation regulator 1